MSAVHVNGEIIREKEGRSGKKKREREGVER